jgi:hypothetical protein
MDAEAVAQVEGNSNQVEVEDNNSNQAQVEDNCNVAQAAHNTGTREL